MGDRRPLDHDQQVALLDQLQDIEEKKNDVEKKSRRAGVVDKIQALKIVRGLGDLQATAVRRLQPTRKELKNDGFKEIPYPIGSPEFDTYVKKLGLKKDALVYDGRGGCWIPPSQEFDA